MAKTSATCLLIALAFAGCKGKPPAPIEELPTVVSPPVEVVVPVEAPKTTPAAQVRASAQLSWTTDSAAADGTLSQQPGNAPGICKLSFFSRRINQEVWTSNNCIAQNDDLRFLSPDGRSVLVLHPELSTQNWKLEALGEATHAGEQVAVIRGAQVLTDNAVTGQHDAHFAWVRGLLPGAEPPPTLDASGTAVNLYALDGAHLSIDFSGGVHQISNAQPEAIETRPSVEADAGQLPVAQAPAAKSPPKPSPAKDAAAEERANFRCRTYGICNGTVTEKPPDSTDFGVPSAHPSGPANVVDDKNTDKVQLDR